MGHSPRGGALRKRRLISGIVKVRGIDAAVGFVCRQRVVAAAQVEALEIESHGEGSEATPRVHVGSTEYLQPDDCKQHVSEDNHAEDVNDLP